MATPLDPKRRWEIHQEIEKKVIEALAESQETMRRMDIQHQHKMNAVMANLYLNRVKAVLGPEYFESVRNEARRSTYRKGNR